MPLSYENLSWSENCRTSTAISNDHTISGPKICRSPCAPIVIKFLVRQRMIYSSSSCLQAQPGHMQQYPFLQHLAVNWNHLLTLFCSVCSLFATNKPTRTKRVRKSCRGSIQKGCQKTRYTKTKNNFITIGQLSLR